MARASQIQFEKPRWRATALFHAPQVAFPVFAIRDARRRQQFVDATVANFRVAQSAQLPDAARRQGKAVVGHHVRICVNLAGDAENEPQSAIADAVIAFGPIA